MKKALLGLLFMSVFAILAACGNGDDSASDSKDNGNLWQEVKDEGVITVGTEGTYAPFTFHNDNGELTGYDIDVMKEVGEHLGLEVKFEETQWDSMFSGLNSERFDVIANQVGKGENNERVDQYDFSDPYTQSQSVVVTAADNNDITSIEDVEGKTSAQSLTSNYNARAEEAGAKIEGVEGLAQSIQLIEQGRVDLTFNDKLAVLDYLNNTEKNAPVKIAFEAGEPTETYFTFRKGSGEIVEQFNNALDEMREDGTLAEISTKWFGEDVNK
ncbi:amino acid ABC transporter substrate-binding protein [Terribacillus sp. DMT04]|uniref:amino acid ABC transporter substrate-binding protein n=1 Tax=Terribacillus sp. DMT04 TaxID=2850441 RepID=UPI001C2C1186|nr:amino acid ABC transporter substrate-binding protein [Terribacillus sp. DMT04]QXE01366.1 amino acid ABC transporter substrate-binding protein [Terribacillus sp. DMT04]